MYAVVGSTGQVGGAVMRELLAHGAEVRALVRDEGKFAQVQALGAEPVLASVEDGPRLEMAFESVEGVFVMTPPLYKSPDPRIEHSVALAALCHALQATHAPRVVFLSSEGAQHAQGTGAILKLYDMEQAFVPLPLNTASIRAAYFMENFLPFVPHARETGKLPSVSEPLDRARPMVATGDIGRAAAELLMESWEGKRTLELEGPRRYSAADAARILSRVLGRTVEPEVVAPGERQAMFERFGMTPCAAQAMVEMAHGAANGLVAFEGGDGVEHMQGATTLEEVLGNK